MVVGRVWVRGGVMEMEVLIGQGWWRGRGLEGKKARVGEGAGLRGSGRGFSECLRKGAGLQKGRGYWDWVGYNKGAWFGERGGARIGGVV